MIREEMLRVFNAFESEGLEYVLIGGTAMGFHGLIRATEDVDLLVRATQANIERLRRALKKATMPVIVESGSDSGPGLRSGTSESCDDLEKNPDFEFVVRKRSGIAKGCVGIIPGHLGDEGDLNRERRWMRRDRWLRVEKQIKTEEETCSDS